MESVQTNPLERRLQLSVPLGDLQQDVDQRLKQMARTARLPGFRPGKVPLRILAQQYAGQFHQEALGERAQDRFGAAVREQNLKVAGGPRFEPALEQAADRFDFTAVFEVYPEVVIGDLSAARIQKPVGEVQDADVERTLEVLRAQRRTYAPVERASASGDQVVIDYDGTLDGVPFKGGQGRGQQLVLGQGRFLVDFENSIAGLAAGERREFPLTFPEQYPAVDLAGKTVQFAVTVTEVLQGQLPDIDAEFVRAVGVPSGEAEALRVELRDNLTRELRGHLKGLLKCRAFQVLLDHTPLDLPSTLLAAEIERLRQDTLENLRQSGRATANPDLPDGMFAEQAKRRVALGLILRELVSREQWVAEPAQVRQLIEEASAAYESPQEVVRWYYQNPERLHEVESLALEDRAVEWICAQAVVEEVPFSVEQMSRAPG